MLHFKALASDLFSMHFWSPRYNLQKTISWLMFFFPILFQLIFMQIYDAHLLNRKMGQKSLPPSPTYMIRSYSTACFFKKASSSSPVTESLKNKLSIDKTIKRSFAHVRFTTDFAAMLWACGVNPFSQVEKPRWIPLRWIGDYFLK